ncbi:unnamed protein product, partial [Prorocentrum cordatum]
MQGVAGAFLAFLTFVVRDHFARRPPWDGGDADWCRSEALTPPPAPPARDDAVCPVSWVHPGIVEELAQQLAADRCVCEVQCNSGARDFALFAGGVGFFGFGQLIYGVTFFGNSSLAAGGLVVVDGDADGAGAPAGPAGAVGLGAVRDATEDPFGPLRAREEPAEGRVWIVCENSDEHETLGLEVTLRPGDIAITSHDGLVHRHGGFLRIRSVPSSECVDFVARLKARYASTAAEPPAGALAIGGAKTPPVEVDDDVRTLWVDYDESGNRFKSFKRAVQESREEPITAVEVQGPPGTLHLARFIERYGGGPRRWWQGFARDHGISKTDRVYHEMTNLTESLKLFGEYDQLNLGASAGIEKLTRRIGGVIDACATGGGVPSWKMAGVYEGEANSIDAIAPALRKWGLAKVKDQNELGQ